ncbi:hypothetical protein [uncultured Arcticibacterium sp.]|uniref:hypothetical protein n=1 Tax=uncultured Arcticibacterium sp. TaxID=2173042 RepID=UPI0030F72CAD
MKTIIILILSLGLVESCTKEDIENNAFSVLDGKWLLESASCFCYFEDDLDFSKHTVTFDGNSKKLTITNPESTFFISKSDEYNYTVNGNLITIEGVDGYFYEFKNGKLLLIRDDDPQIADDELTLTYTKN